MDVLYRIYEDGEVVNEDDFAERDFFGEIQFFSTVIVPEEIVQYIITESGGK